MQLLKKNLIIFTIIALLFCILKNVGLYILLFSFPFALIFTNKHRLFFLLYFIIPLSLYGVYSKILLPNIGVVKGDYIREMSSIPTQQMARTFTYDKLNDKDIELLSTFYSLDSFKYYKDNPSISDLTKGALYEEYTEKHLKTYVHLWIKLGIKHPINYVEAFMMNTLGWWYPNKNYYDPRIWNKYLFYDMIDAKAWNKDYLEINRYSLIKPYDRYIHSTIEENGWTCIPVINTLFTFGFYSLLILLSLILNILKKKYYLIVPYSFIVAFYLTLLLAPGAISRYYFPILLIIPICLSDIFILKEKQ